MLQTKLRKSRKLTRVRLPQAVDQVLADVGLTGKRTAGGKLTFFGQDSDRAKQLQVWRMAAVAWLARSIALAALWKSRTGEGQDIHVDVREALRRFCGFFEGKWETITRRSPLLLPRDNPFSSCLLFRKTRDGRHVVVLNIYPGLQARAPIF